MHPILGRQRLRIYLAAWIPVAVLLAVLAGPMSGRGWVEAFALTLPLALLCAFICLGSYSLCRAFPLGRGGLGRLAMALGTAAAASSGLWLLFGMGWALALERILRDPGVSNRFLASLPFFFSAGVLLFLLTAAVHYLLIAVEASRAAEREALELQVLARDAQLKTLTAQVNPHFLFNSLNSIGALAGSDPAAARRMCLLLAEFLRATLALGARDEIRLGEELTLVDRFLSIEQVRFGQRLVVERSVEPGAEDRLVPPLVLQPLVENAVNHGIAHLLHGGVLEIEAAVRGGRLTLRVSNPCEPDRPASRGAGLGLANVKARLAAQYGPGANVEVRDNRESFAVELRFPAAAPRGGAPRGVPSEVPTSVPPGVPGGIPGEVPGDLL